MLSNNIKILRTQKELSQEELADRLHVVRQTISKWEKGLSVPDAELLIRLAEIFETSVSELLGETITASGDKEHVAEKLDQLNILLAEKNRRIRRILKTVAIVFIAAAIIALSLIVLGFSA